MREPPCGHARQPPFELVLLQTWTPDQTNKQLIKITNPFFQEQLKFIYDTLEESVVCGHTYFPVKDISLHLKQKSVHPTKSRKSNQYAKEYGVRI